MSFPSFRCTAYDHESRQWSDSGVQATLSDKRRSVCNEELGIAYFEAEVLTQTDYYPFGSVMPDRQWSAGAEGYRYGFNGMERDDEVKGSGNSIAYDARILDSRLGRWMSFDPKESSYPSWSTYNAFMCNPILIIDPDGKGGIVSKVRDPETGKTLALEVTATIYVYTDVQEIRNDITNVANTLETDIEYYWNNVVTGDRTGNGVATDANGNALPVIFNVTVVPITRIEAEAMAKSGKVGQDENFVELVNNEIPSQFDGNSGVINLNQNIATNRTTASHEFGHLLNYVNKNSKNTPDNEYHAGDYDPSSENPVPIMYRSIQAESTIEKSRVVTPTDVDRLNNGRGVGADVMGKRGVNSANIGTPNNNKIYKDGIKQQ